MSSRLLRITEEETAATADEDLALQASREAFAATVDGVVFSAPAVHGSDLSHLPDRGRRRPRRRSAGPPRRHHAGRVRHRTPGRPRGTGRQPGPARGRDPGGGRGGPRQGPRCTEGSRPRDGEGRTATVTGAEEACARADVIVTATDATADAPPLFQAEWVRPGTHISCMGADAPGKREPDPRLFSVARLCCDLPEQARSMGESRHTPEETVLMPLGEVLTGRGTGRAADADITLFDSSGTGLQDLYLGLALLKKLDMTL